MARAVVAAVAGAVTGLVDGAVWHRASDCRDGSEQFGCMNAALGGLAWGVPFTIVAAFVAMGVPRVRRWGAAALTALALFLMLIVLAQALFPGSTPPTGALVVAGALAFGGAAAYAGTGG